MCEFVGRDLFFGKGFPTNCTGRWLRVDRPYCADDLELEADLAQVLGYLNFSAGKPDAKTLAALNRVYARALPGGPYTGLPAWLQIQQWLQDALTRLSASNPAFRTSEQAAAVIDLVWLHLLPSYMDFHRDLLFHQEPESIFNGFMLGRAIEAVLQQGGPWEEVDRITSGAIRRLNDFVGYRPVAVLENRRLEPYPNEMVRPVPLYISGVGVTAGPYEGVVKECVAILKRADPDTLRRAYFDFSMLDELAIDPRAYDFDHPVNQRPNYHFGQWDPNLIDNSGNYRRFVVQQVTLDALLARLEDEPSAPREELLFEAAAVLAGTILMASGISGSGPGVFASTVTLGSLLPLIAEYRDAFYEQLLDQMSGSHLERLLEEQKIRRQPFGGARQHLNTYLAKHRASQLEHVQLARLFARMGNAAASKEQSEYVPVPSARIISRIDCLMTAADHFLQVGRLDDAVAVSPQVMDLVHRGIHCGAIVDPWNILGFAGNFTRFGGPDSAVHDHRVEDLVQLMEMVFALQSRIWREAAGSGREDLCQQIERQLRTNANWWRQFAAHEVSDVEATDPQETLDSAELVAKALSLWHAGGAAAGDVRFWAPHANLFDSPKAYALVVESLLERNDFVASMALLVHWLFQAENVGLQKGSASFSDLARRWLQRLEFVLESAQSAKAAAIAANASAATSSEASSAEKPTGSDPAVQNPGLSWSVAQKFFDNLEANANNYWIAPEFRLAKPDFRKRKSNDEFASAGDSGMLDPESGEDEEEGSPYGAAWDDVVYEDTTDDGVEGEVSEEGDTQNTSELIEESNRLNQHLTFLTALAQMWKGAALSSLLRREITEDPKVGKSRLEAMESWAAQASANRIGLLSLLDEVSKFKLSNGGANQEAMSLYDRQRLVKESLLERIISTALETADARRMLLATLQACGQVSDSLTTELRDLPEDDRSAVEMFGSLLHGNFAQVEKNFAQLILALREKKLLYIPLARGGDPRQIYSVRLRRRMLSHLLVWLPRQGLFKQACQLIEAARFMEHNNPIGPGAVTEFDDLFHLGYISMVRAVVRNAYEWRLAELRASKAPLKVKGKSAGSSAKNKKRAQELVSIDELAAKIDFDTHDGAALEELEPESDGLIDVLEQLTEVMLGCWLSHSRTLRLSVLETVDNSKNWQRLTSFIQRYGGSIFTQSFLRLSNVRAILHQGVGNWLQNVREDGYNEGLQPLLDAIDEGEIESSQAEHELSVVLEAIIDHYSEYRDYNSTTTQSDRGEMLYMLLDFLRLRVRYDRVSWNLRPIYWTHEVLVRAGCHQTAQQWRRALAERICRESEAYIEQLALLQKKYAMRMPTVADRLHERFTRPMTVDRMRALVGPSVRQYRETGETSDVFDLLIEECKLMMEQPTGVGLDVPQWLGALEAEVDRVLENQRGFHQKPQYDDAVAFRSITKEQIVDQLNAATKQIKTLNLPSESSTTSEPPPPQSSGTESKPPKPPSE